MKYELEIVYKERILGPVQHYWKSVVSEERLDYVKNQYLECCKGLINVNHVYDAWLKINLLSDDGEFIEVVL